jgi:FkbM family methyltransferase
MDIPQFGIGSRPALASIGRRVRKVLKQGVRGGLHLVGLDVIRARPRPREVVNAHYRGHCFRCFAGDILCESILRGREYDSQLDEILRLLPLLADVHVVEVGANIGASLVPRARDFPRFTFHCVEPVPEFFALLRENAASFSAENVRLYNKAITEAEGARVEIHTQLGTAGALPTYDGHRQVGTVVLKGTTIDELFPYLPISLIKIDTDGFELSVLKGARQTLVRCRPWIFMEYHPDVMLAAGTKPQEVNNYLRNLSYPRIRIWDTFGRFLFETKSYDDLLTAAQSATYYVDALFLPSDARAW